MHPKLNHRSTLLARADGARRKATSALDATRRSDLGQFMTPSPVAAFMASMFHLPAKHIRLLDAGAGVGSLTAAFVAAALQRATPPVSIEATAFELEPTVLGHLRTVLRSCGREARSTGTRFVARIDDRDFIVAAAGMLDAGLFAAPVTSRFNAAILNPPYRKIHSRSSERGLLRALSIETSNLYTAFVGLTIKLLEPGGELVAITPRSFCNGPYFRAFRELLLRETALLRIHVFDTRDRAFRDDAVLQENVIFHARKGGRSERVKLSASAGPESEVRERLVPYDQVVAPDDPQSFIHLAISDHDSAMAQRIAALPCTLIDLGIQVSTGRVVDFRSREHLRKDPGARTVPLIYPAHFDSGYVSWPRKNCRKPNALADERETRPLMIANDTYVLTKRFTSKEERRRIVAVVHDPARLPDHVERVAFENHVNYFHVNGAGLPKAVANGLAAFLNTSLADGYFRQFNGHTQVNASDLRSFRYPSLDQLRSIGRRIGSSVLDQAGLDGKVDGVLSRPPKLSAR